MSFCDPGFLLLLGLPCIWLALRRLRRPKGRGAGSIAFPAADALAACGTTWRARTRALPGLLLGCGVVLAVVALARPVEVRSQIPLLSEGVDLVLVVDHSSSMGEPIRSGLEDRHDGSGAGDGRDAEGVAPARSSALDLVKAAAARFVDSRPHDRIAVVTFSRTSKTLTPFTLDHGAVAERLRGVTAVPDRSEEDGTAIGAGLAEAARLCRASRAENRVVILLTDGRENRFTIEPLAAARLCADMGIRVHTVALDLREERLTDDLHREIAALTGGEALHVGRSGDLARALGRLDLLEKSPIEGRAVNYYHDRYRAFLLPAAALLLAGVCLTLTVYRRLPC